MKAVKLITITLSLLTISMISASAASASTVESLLPNIRDRVRDCSILPYHYKDNNRVDHAIMSHCPEVKVVPVEHGMPQAKIKVAAHTFIATLIETQFSDGDMFDVEIKDVVTNDSYKMTNVLAFGDVLLGVLGGSTNGIRDNMLVQ